VLHVHGFAYSYASYTGAGDDRVSHIGALCVMHSAVSFFHGGPDGPQTTKNMVEWATMHCVAPFDISSM